MVSNSCLLRAWATRTKTPAQKLVLVRLADRANGPNNSCWPGVASIAKDCGLSESSVHRAINELLRDGTIKLQRGGGATPNTYFLNDTPVMVTPLSERHPCQDDTGGVPHRHPSPPTVTPEGCHGDTQTLINPKEPKSNPHTVGSANSPKSGTVPNPPPRMVSARKPGSVQEVITSGQIVGVTEQVCRDWFRDCEEAGWIRGDGTPFDNWRKQLQIHRDKLRSLPGHDSNGKPMSVMDLKSIIEIKKAKAVKLKNSFFTDGPVNGSWDNETHRVEYKRLWNEIRDLEAKIEAKAQ